MYPLMIPCRHVIFSLFPSSLGELGGLLSQRFFLVSFPSLLSNLGGCILSLITLFPDFMAIFYDSNCVCQIRHFDQIKYGSVLVLGSPQLDMMGTIQPCHIQWSCISSSCSFHPLNEKPWDSSSWSRNPLPCIVICSGHHQPTRLVFSLWFQE